MKRFKVINPKGFSFGGKLLEKGEIFEAENKSAHIQTGLHFKQIVEVNEPAPKSKEPAKDEVAPK
jgi:hypothetical protein